MKNFLSELQKKPYETRVKILWGTTAVAAIVIIVIWTFTLKDTVGNIGPISLTPSGQINKNQSEISVITIERAERINNNLRIYFNINNATDDILTFSKLEDVELELSSGKKQPISLLDRQGLPLVQKVLSHTQIFGTLIFDNTEETEATLKFNNMFFEKAPDNTLMQTLPLNLQTLIQNSEVRN